MTTVKRLVRRLRFTPRTFVRLFMSRFAGLVENGDKRQTVRPTPDIIPQVGDRLSLRAWIGKAYRSKQRLLREAVVTMVHEIKITNDGIYLYDVRDGGGWSPDLEAFAHADGFDCWADLHRWFHHTHGLPFTGIVIYWN